MNKKPQADSDKSGWLNTLGLITGFGASFALEVYFVGVVFGGWLDDILTGGRGYITILMVIASIVLAFVTFFRIVLRMENIHNKTGSGEQDVPVERDDSKR